MRKKSTSADVCRARKSDRYLYDFKDRPKLRPLVPRAQEVRSEFLARMSQMFDAFVSANATSPIEEIFLGAMMTDGWDLEVYGISFEAEQWQKSATDIGRRLNVFVLYDDWCFPQLEVIAGDKCYRLDFAFISDGLRFAVELDGHAFHEATKEQAARDRERERDLTLAGWQVIRFTGSEVYRDPLACTGRVRDIIQSARAARDLVRWQEMQRVLNDQPEDTRGGTR